LLPTLLVTLVLLLGFLANAGVSEDQLPAGVVNTALEDFGDLVGGGDYGLGNHVRVETVTQGDRKEVRVFRSPELKLSRSRKASFQVLLGNVTGVYLWIETPPVQGHWHLTIDLVYPDGARQELFSKDMKREVRDWMAVVPGTLLDCRMYTKTTAITLSRKFRFNISPEIYSIWPDYLPVPYRTIFE
jgi:hypothetical protein